VLLRNKRKEKRAGGMTVKKGKALNVTFIAWHYSMCWVLNYMGQRGFEHSDVRASRKFI
jgi:hypothetical protein